MSTRKISPIKGDYLPAHNFKLDIEGVTSGGFKEVTGLESEVEVIEVRDGDDPITRKRPGKPKFKNIVLKRGFIDDKALYEWYKKVLAGSTERHNASLIYTDRVHGEIIRYNLKECWPCRWKSPEVNAHSDQHLVEEIEFVVEEVVRG